MGGRNVSDRIEMTESAGRCMALGNTCKQTQCHTLSRKDLTLPITPLAWQQGPKAITQHFSLSCILHLFLKGAHNHFFSLKQFHINELKHWKTPITSVKTFNFTYSRSSLILQSHDDPNAACFLSNPTYYQTSCSQNTLIIVDCEQRISIMASITEHLSLRNATFTLLCVNIMLCSH